MTKHCNSFPSHFSQTPRERSQKTGLKRKSPLDEEEENSDDSFRLVSDHEEEDVNNEKVDNRCLVVKYSKTGIQSMNTVDVLNFLWG